CNFTNPSEAIYCECGYRFEDVVLPTKKCPNSKCNFTNPSEAIYCECGYHFEDVVLPTKKCPNTDCDFSSPLAAICCECGYKFVKEAPREAPVEELLRCSHCNSTQLTANKQGFGWKKGVGIAVCTIGIGALAGFINSNKVWITCLKCGHRWKAGEDSRNDPNLLSGSEALAAYKKKQKEG
ncbi:MAG: hypothetical protein HON76_11905, partial [Candidatus Scalindua sp.]|nr:hypothetical protein [Candidatus Scalindua sp.]